MIYQLYLFKIYKISWRNVLVFFLIEWMNVWKELLNDEYSYYNHEDERDSLKGNNTYTIIQKSTLNEYVPHGDYTKMENYDILQNFLKKPLVKIYIEEIFLPNKEIKKVFK